ncbi:hypothetical protein BN7_4796 [Wickerhamomyces ciferrii]|uniref:DUF155 domain-containing protein n=1 Tax=Wickerhamomyces ciferrii (strain ATCC 14091 / BCRC 22168 / CBS 111 / JCM 3599 / NBRC 0793 / NRRL Y-1031 F-60-10) TaxID=1206466 RepID=K0KJ12_WICCF|nr:uncharacterized protein BN7_4796 [Wickerhamomyces ciferrii]CCH45215.1 hypothetical protein BN7_4796 [Wickerhamomyces ciferrii]
MMLQNILSRQIRIPLRTNTFIPRLFSTNIPKFNNSTNSNFNNFSKTPKTSRNTTSQSFRKAKRNAQNKYKYNNDSSKRSNFIEELKNQQTIQPCTTFTTSESYDFDKMLKSFNNGIQLSVIVPNEILYFKFEKTHDVFILIDGSVVVWGMDESNVEKKILPLFKKFEKSSYENPESEDMDYIETKDLHDEQNSYLEEDIIVINSLDKDQDLLDKAAFSSGLSRSTRLAILENSLERHILQTRKMSEHLSIGKKLTVTEKELLRSTGRLFLLRGKLNLYSELIGIPDLYWSEPNLEKIYRQISNNLDISQRISILNKKLDYATEESRALMSTLNEEKSTRLEWIIIYLIMIEVCFEIFHFYERYSDYKEK